MAQPLETSGIILQCDGAAASALFKAMELVATQDMSNAPHVWRRSKGIQCDLETGPLPAYMCTVTIEAETASSKSAAVDSTLAPFFCPWNRFSPRLAGE
jgi:hypothetical protein